MLLGKTQIRGSRLRTLQFLGCSSLSETQETLVYHRLFCLIYLDRLALTIKEGVQTPGSSIQKPHKALHEVERRATTLLLESHE